MNNLASVALEESRVISMIHEQLGERGIGGKQSNFNDT